MAAPARMSDASVHIHIEAKHEDRIAIRLEADEVRVDAQLTRETRGWKLRYLDLHGARSPSRTPDIPSETSAARDGLGGCSRAWSPAPALFVGRPAASLQADRQGMQQHHWTSTRFTHLAMPP